MKIENVSTAKNIYQSQTICDVGFIFSTKNTNQLLRFCRYSCFSFKISKIDVNILGHLIINNLTAFFSNKGIVMFIKPRTLYFSSFVR